MKLGQFFRQKLRPRYRIVESWPGWYIVQVKRWWFPFWEDYNNETYTSIEDARCELRDHLRYGRVVCYVDPV